ncbi:MAG: ABC transporter substrate-binding protein [Myxococcales bacterium]|nr:ABC transporter substrate-binding protein [Myxococcales bacterium]
MKPVALFLLALALVAAPAAAQAADGPGTRVVRSANDTIAKLLKQKARPGSEEEKKAAARVTESVRGFLDIDELARRALVDHWGKVSDAQRAEFLALLRALIEDNYVKGLRANLEYQVAYKGEGPASAGDDKAVVVKTEITAKKKGRPVKISVDYVLIEVGGKLRCYDIRTDGVGLVENYRAQFNKIIAKDGFDGLITRMKKKRAAT